MPRPVAPLLSVPLIADTVLALVEETGTFSIPAVAHRLGVAKSALYNHVAGRQGLVDAARDRIIQLHPIYLGDTDDWAAAVTSYAHSMRDAYLAYPDFVHQLSATPIYSPEWLDAYAELLAVLERAGFSADDGRLFVAAVHTLRVGSSVRHAAFRVDRTDALPGDFFETVFDYSLAALIAGR